MKNGHINQSRRRFIAGAGVSAGATGLGLGFANRVSAGTAGTTPTKLLVYVFLRGGYDGLSYIVPTSGANLSNYMNDRPNISIDPAETLDLSVTPGGAGFGLHPFCDDLYSIRQKVAFVQACGHPLDALTRSHFDAQEEIELGSPGSQNSAGGGFMNRYLSSIAHDPDAVFTALASSSNPPVSLAGYPDVATVSSSGGFSPNGGTFADTHLRMLNELYSGAGSLDLAGQATVDAVDLINSFDLDDYQPAGNVDYPNTGIGNDLALIAQLWKLDLGISAATVDRGGWDTHNGQNTLNANAGFGRGIREVSEALFALYSDIANDPNRNANDLCIIVQSEFGRQVSENGNFGTDHGFAAPMTIIGGNVLGGVYGTFPGIASSERQGDAVVPSTDFRNVQATVMDRVLGAPNGTISNVFPDLSYSPVPFF